MSSYKKKSDLFDTEEGTKIEEELKKMAGDVAYSTKASYSANSSLHPDNLITFVDKHMAYLRSHTSTDPQQYLANLRLITRIR